MSIEKEKEISIVFNNCVSIEARLLTIGYFKHLKLEKIISSGKVVGFKFDIDQFNKVVYNGCKQQVRKRCKETQTEEEKSSQPETLGERSHSPSIFGEEVQHLYARL